LGEGQVLAKNVAALVVLRPKDVRQAVHVAKLGDRVINMLVPGNR